MTVAKYAVWLYSYGMHSLEVRVCDDKQEAFETAYYAEESDNYACNHIEGPGSEADLTNEYLEWSKEFSVRHRREVEERRVRWAEVPRVHLEVRRPGRQGIHRESYTVGVSDEAFEDNLRKYVAVFGPDRVKVMGTHEHQPL